MATSIPTAGEPQSGGPRYISSTPAGGETCSGTIPGPVQWMRVKHSGK